jgi:hypothetical protein
MAKVAYMVVATLPNAAMVDEYIAWLQDGHIQAVVKGGATMGEVIRLDVEQAGGSARVMSRYEFPSRGEFDRYVKEKAPGLRAEGLAKFGSDRGVTYQRYVGEVAEARSSE